MLNSGVHDRLTYMYNVHILALCPPISTRRRTRQTSESMVCRSPRATGVLGDPLALTVEDDSAEGEQRFVTIGVNVFGTVMVVVHTPRRERPRIISVRKPDPKERRDYEKGV